MKMSSTDHATFVIERDLRAPVGRAFAAWADPRAKQQWFACHDNWVSLEYDLDFRVGGAEVNRVADAEGIVHAYDARYLDIVPGARIIYAYDMKLGDNRISASLTTVTFQPTPQGTKMTFTEQVVFLDGYTDDGSRRQGTEILIDNVQAFIERESEIVH